MNTTDELREFVRGADGYELWCPRHRAELLAIADRIDAEHERQLEVLYRDMSDAEYVELPVDANGEYIHIGDVMEVINSKQRAEACYMQMGPSGTWAVGLTKNCHWYDTESLRHHHAPTVEDVLREFALACEDAGNAGPEVERIAAEYAAKLQLKEDA